MTLKDSQLRGMGKAIANYLSFLWPLVTAVAVVIALGTAISVTLNLLFDLPFDKFFGRFVGQLSKCTGTPFQDCGDVLSNVSRFIPLLMSAVGFTICYRAGYFNIGIEGQFLIGMISAAIGVHLVIGLQREITLQVVLVAGTFSFIGVFGWGLIPFALAQGRAKDAILANLVANILAIGAAAYALDALHLLASDSQGVATIRVLEQTLLEANAGTNQILLRIVAGAALIVISVFYLLHRTRIGLFMRLQNENQRAARLLGIQPTRYQFLATVLGFLCVSVAAVTSFLTWGRGSVDHVSGIGFDAIVIAILSRFNAVAMPIFAIFFLLLRDFGRQLQLADQSPQIALIFQGLTLAVVLYLSHYSRTRGANV